MHPAALSAFLSLSLTLTLIGSHGSTRRYPSTYHPFPNTYSPFPNTHSPIPNTQSLIPNPLSISSSRLGLLQDFPDPSLHLRHQILGFLFRATKVQDQHLALDQDIGGRDEVISVRDQRLQGAIGAA